MNNTGNTNNADNPNNKKWVYILVVIAVILIGVLLYNKVNSNNADNSSSEEDTSNADTNKINTDIEETKVEVEKIDINDFKHNTLGIDWIDCNFLGAIDNHLYGIGKGFSGDGLKEKVIFYEYTDQEGAAEVQYSNSDPSSDDGVIANMFSVQNIGENVYSFVDYNGADYSINEIAGIDFNTRSDKLYKQVETNNEFVIHNAYVCGDDIYEFAHYNTGIDTISSEKKGVLKSYKAMDYSFLATTDGDKFYYALLNINDNSMEVYEDDVLICSFNVGDWIVRMNHYESYFIFESSDNMYIYNELKGSVKEIQNFTCNFMYDDFIYDNKAYYISDGNIMYYDFSNDQIEKLASLDKDLYNIVGIDNDKVILQYEDADTSSQGLAVYSKGENKLYKYSELKGSVKVFYNESYIIVVEKNLDNNQLNKFEIKI